MRVQEVGVRALAAASLRAEDAHEPATLRGRPPLEIRDERRDQRQPSEGATLGCRPGGPPGDAERAPRAGRQPSVADRKSTRLNSSHVSISYAVFCLKKKKNNRR